ncbi:hypothetical protein IFM89_008694 [Coptis chinensis]|uniref:DUF4216 domain-containing protein n=1 Tax=Coptis chinensis TaxID=261450 RepID=A0A835LDB9_9MAGN|nr:hypothetical protein IFM89_008694 [Coptis chinensis]
MSFIPWLREQLQNEEVSPIKRLADGPNFQTISYNTYQANGYVFSTAEWDTNKTTQNSGIKMNAMTNFRASAKDKKLVSDDTTYYGIIRQILELDYFDFTITVFCCDWVRVEDKVNGCYTDPDINLTFVDLSKFKGSSKIVDEPFILASQASQVKYSAFLPNCVGVSLSVYLLKSIGSDMSGQGEHEGASSAVDYLELQEEKEYNVDDAYKKINLKKVAKSFREIKHRLRVKYYDKYDNDVDRKRNPKQSEIGRMGKIKWIMNLNLRKTHAWTKGKTAREAVKALHTS